MDSTPILEFNLKLFMINGLTRDVTLNIKNNKIILISPTNKKIAI